MDPWPHQVRGVEGVLAAVARGEAPVCLTAPTGAGKTYMIEQLCRHFLDRNEKVVLYTNRRLLLDQICGVLDRAGLRHGVRAADYDDERHLAFQVSSIKTEESRVFRKGNWELHQAGLAVIDECHQFTEGIARQVIEAHQKQGAAVVGVTATPLDLEGIYQSLVVAGKTSELRACGALVPCLHYGPDEPDLRKLRGVQLGVDLTEQQNVRAMMTPTIFGRVLEWFDKINPEHKPSILFAPSVEASIWFHEQFAFPHLRDEELRHLPAISAAHIDGQEVIVNGRREKTTADARARVLAMSRAGDVVVLCNRYVLREGVDAPWLAHGIFATVFGSLQSYLQSGGRLLRAYPGLSSVTLQDHGGCLDEATEVLTARGWLGCDDIKDNDVVAAFDRFSGSIVWKDILHRHERILGHGEIMLEAKGRQVDLRVTGNHRLLFNKRTTDAENRPVWPDSFSLERADILAESRVGFKIPISGIQKAPGLPLTDDQLRFIGWWLTDGTMAGKRKAVSITQAVHQPHVADLRACLVGCGFDFTEKNRQPKYFENSKPQICFSVPKGTGSGAKKRNGWWPLRNYLDKDLALCMELIDERQFGVLLHAIHLGDGDKGKNEGSYRISTGNKKFADRLQSLCVRRGWKCSVSTHQEIERRNPIYIINAQKKSTLVIQGEGGMDGQTSLSLSPSVAGVTKVWCVANEMETLVTRRNGKVAIIGNSWWRHGSLNADRDWQLGARNVVAAGLREMAMRNREMREPVRCPRCAKILQRGRCGCGWVPDGQQARPVIQVDGTCKVLDGPIFKPRKVREVPDAEAKWTRMYYRAKKSGMTFRQAEALFAQENAWNWPPHTLPLMPTNDLDWYRRVADCDPGTLTRRPEL